MKFIKTLLLLSVLVFNFALFAQAGSEGMEKDLRSDLVEYRQELGQQLHDSQSGTAGRFDPARVSGIVESIQINRLLLQEKFQARQSQLTGQAAIRHQAMAQRFEERTQKLLDKTSLILNQEQISVDDLNVLLELLKEDLPQKKYPLLGSLPYRNLNYPARTPDEESTVDPAYLGGDKEPQPEDTLSSNEVPLTPEIRTLAEELEWNPVRIYEWVQNNIKTEWYWGSMKGAAETLRQGSGNDADQAALLIALLRASDYPARFVRGVIEFFPDLNKAENLTGLDDPQQVMAFLQKAGIPFRPVIAGGKVVNLQIEHLWVETLVPYSNYRGALLDEMGKNWVALDASIKVPDYEWNEPHELPAGFSLSTLRDDYLNEPRETTPLIYLKNGLDQYLSRNYSEITHQDLIAQHSSSPFKLNILPASLQFTTMAITGEYVALPDELKHKVNFNAEGPDGSVLFNATFELSDLSNRAVTLTYEPETVEDQALINSYGGLGNTPSYLVHLRPVLQVDGERKLVAQDGLAMGEEFTLTVELITPAGTERTANNHIVGNVASLGIVAQQVVMPEVVPDEEKDAARLLHEESLGYIERWNRAEEELASLLNVRLIRPLATVVTVGGVLEVSELFGTPHDITWKGVYIDAGLRRVETVATSGDENDSAQFMRLSALQGSALESRLFEDDFQVDSISTAKLFGMAAEQNVALLTLDKTNVDTLLPELPFQEHVKEDIVNAVGQGFVVTVPESEMQYQNWSGIGYLKEDPQTGEAGYMLSGMIAGGMTAEEWAEGWLKSRFENTFSEPPNADPLSAAYLVKIPAGDRETGVVGKQIDQPLAVLVTDYKGRPVEGAIVTFTTLDESGSFEGLLQIEVRTGGNGIAKALPTLGTDTGKNSTYRKIGADDKIPTQVGINHFSASVVGDYGTIALSEPFELYARPDEPVLINKVLGDGNAHFANNPGGTLRVQVVDQHGNPVSNVPVTFAVSKTQSMLPTVPLPEGYRAVQFYKADKCTVEQPIFGECSSYSSLPDITTPYGAQVETFLGNTVATSYTIEASAESLSTVEFMLYTTGSTEPGAYLPAQLLVSALMPVSQKGRPINAARAGEPLSEPLTATMVMLYNGYTMEGPQTCNRDGNPEAECWTLVSDGIVHTQRIKDGTMTYKPTEGDGTAIPLETLDDGVHRSNYITGSEPALNIVEIFGEAEIDAPVVFARDQFGNVRLTGYASHSLPQVKVLLKNGQSAVFDRETGEPVPTESWSLIHEIYGVDVPTSVAPEIALLGQDGQAQHDIKVNYEILPQGDNDSGYQADTVQIDLWTNDGSGPDAWVGYLVGDVLHGQGSEKWIYGTRFDPKKKYFAQTVLNRGTGVEVRGDKVPIRVVLVDLDIDSDNNAGWNEDGTHRLPSRDELEDQVESLAASPGKVIKPNLLDVDRDGVPGYADGINKFQNEGDSASASFVPVVLELDGEFDPAQIRVRFNYSASDPNAVSRTEKESNVYNYEPAPGSLRLWTKDGGFSRNVADIAGGGNYVAPEKDYRLSQLSSAQAGDKWLFYLEGLATAESAATQAIKVTIDVDGSGPLPQMEGDVVNTTAVMASLVPDYNHDRKIDEEDFKRAVAGDTYYFWINNDDDSGETGGDDIPISNIYLRGNQMDSFNDQVDGIRDLVDFFPMYLNLQSVVEVFSPEKFTYRFISEDENINFFVTDLTDNTAGEYQANVATAEQVIKDSYIYKPRTYNRESPGIAFTRAGSSLGQLGLFLKKIHDEKGKGVILVEGTKKGDKPLLVEIYNQFDEKVFSAELDLHLNSVEQMFLHANLIQAINDSNAPETETGTIGQQRAKGGEKSRLSSDDFGNKAFFEGFQSECENKFFFMLHGFNNDGQVARGWHSEMFKRLYWAGSKIKFVGVSWFGFESVPDYHTNVYNAFKTASVLGPAIKLVAGNAPVSIMGHSLGNMVVSSYLADHYSLESEGNRPNIANYFLVNAAVPLEAYIGDYEEYAEGRQSELFGPENPMVHTDWYGYQKRLGSSEWHQLFKNPDDPRRGLTWRNQFFDFSGVNLYNFYSKGEDVLATHTGVPDVFEAVANTLLHDGRNAWVFQEKWKGKAPVSGKGGTTRIGWGFNLLEGGYYTINGGISKQVSPLIANGFSDSQLITRPFFKKPLNGELGASLFEQNINPDYMTQNKFELLAKSIPALTLPAGGEAGNDLVTEEFLEYENSVDMNSKIIYWPREEDHWLHSDIKKVAFPYVFLVFDELVKKVNK